MLMPCHAVVMQLSAIYEADEHHVEPLLIAIELA